MRIYVYATIYNHLIPYDLLMHAIDVKQFNAGQGR
jgi:hypothetical protein